MFLWRYYKVRRTTLIGLGCLACMVGLALPKIGIISSDVMLLVLAASFLLWCRRRWWLVAVPAVIICGLLVGLWRGSSIQQQVDGYTAHINQTITVRALVREDPTYDKKHHLVLMLGNIVVDGKNMPGTMRVTTLAPVQPQRGDELLVTGKLRDGFGNYQASMYFASVSVVQPQTSWLESLRHQFSATILSILPEPQASLALGFLVGLKSQLPGELSEQLRVLGLTHIVVASGYNLTILVRLSRRLLARFSKYQAMLAASAMIAAFVTITGFSASMSRAALVTSLALAAWYYGRRIHPVVLLLVASAITAMVNPLFLWSDVGWWLSFLAFAGVMLGAPLVQRKIFGDKKAPTLVQIAIETLCAELLTLPLILFVFGDLPLLALLANVLVVPFIPLVMLLTFVAGAVGWFVPMIAAWVAQPALWVLTYMTNSVSLLSQLPWATMHITITATGMVLLLLSVCLSGFVMYKKMRFNYLQTSVIE